MIISSRYGGTMGEPSPYSTFDSINEAKAQIAAAEVSLKRQKLLAAIDYLDEVLPEMKGYDKVGDLKRAADVIRGALMSLDGALMSLHEPIPSRAAEVVMAS